MELTDNENDSIVRVEYSESIDALLQFGRSLCASCSSMYTTYPFFIYSSEFFSMGLKVDLRKKNDR